MRQKSTMYKLTESIIQNINKTLTEGIHLVAYVEGPDGQVKSIEDNDYNSKEQFSNDLKANEYRVLSINDNRDLYVADNSNFGKLNQLYNEMMKYKKFWKDSQKDNPDSTLWKDNYEKLKKLYDDAIKQPLI